jgi:hypothetical protein
MTRDRSADSSEPDWVEVAYRRGYHQAVAVTLRAVSEGAALLDLRRWERQLRDWRTRGWTWKEGPTVAGFPPRPPEVGLLTINDRRDQVQRHGWALDETDVFYVPDRSVPDWVLESLVAEALIRPFLFVWRSDPAAVVVRLSDGEIRKITSAKSALLFDATPILGVLATIGSGPPPDCPAPWAMGGVI